MRADNEGASDGEDEGSDEAESGGDESDYSYAYEDEDEANYGSLIARVDADDEHAPLLVTSPPGAPAASAAEMQFEKAVQAAREITALVKTANEYYIRNNPQLQRYCVETFDVNDLIFLAKETLDLQQGFIDKGADGCIDTGYHYTNSINIFNIRDHGLMTAAERQSNGVVAGANGAVFGDGIYTANNGALSQDYGDVGLTVGRLKGKAVRVAGFLDESQTVDADMIVGNKQAGYRSNGRLWPENDTRDEVVL